MELNDIFNTVQDLATIFYYALFLGLTITKKQHAWLLATILTALGMSSFYFGWPEWSYNPFSYSWIPQFYILVGCLLCYAWKIRYERNLGFYVEGIPYNSANYESWISAAQEQLVLAAFAISMILQHLALAFDFLIRTLVHAILLGDLSWLFLETQNRFHLYIVYTMYPMYWEIAHVTGMAMIWFLAQNSPAKPRTLGARHALALFALYVLVLNVVRATLFVPAPAI